MRILTRYVLKEFLTPVFYCLVAFASLYLVIDIFGEFDKIIPAKPSVRILLGYMGGVLAKDFQWLVTPSVLLGGLYAMWQLARHSEITAMRATGISFMSIAAPMIWASLFFSALVFANSEFFAPRATREAKCIKDADFLDYREKVYENVPFNNVKENRNWQLDTFDSASNLVTGVRISWIGKDNLPVKSLSASRGFYRDRAWWFENAEFLTFSYDTNTRAQVVKSREKRPLLIMSELEETPRDFIVEILQGAVVEDRENLSSRDMIRYVDMRPNLTHLQRDSWRYDICYRFVAPLACVVIALFAVPAGVATGRQSVFVGVVTALLLFLSFYALTMLCNVMAQKGELPIYVAVLLPNLVVFCAGAYMFWKQR